MFGDFVRERTASRNNDCTKNEVVCLNSPQFSCSKFDLRRPCGPKTNANFRKSLAQRMQWERAAAGMEGLFLCRPLN
jgi:hypothetical protein